MVDLHVRVPKREISWTEALNVYAALVGLWGVGAGVTTLSFEWASPDALGWSISVGALVGLVIFVGIRGARAFVQRSERTPLERWHFTFWEDTWEESDLAAVAEMGHDALGERFGALEWLVSVLKRNREVLRIVRRRTTHNDHEIQGFILLYPITVDAARRIQRGDIRSGLSLRSSDLCKSFRRARSLYIGMIAGRGATAKGFALHALQRWLIAQREQSHPFVVFGRPATKDGTRLLRKFGFTPIPGNEGIFEEDYERLYALIT